MSWHRKMSVITPVEVCPISGALMPVSTRVRRSRAEQEEQISSMLSRKLDETNRNDDE